MNYTDGDDKNNNISWSHAITNFISPTSDYELDNFKRLHCFHSAKKLFQKGNLENKRMILTLSGADVRARSVGINS